MAGPSDSIMGRPDRRPMGFAQKRLPAQKQNIVLKNSRKPGGARPFRHLARR
jgi:hypothetical protein